MTLNSFDIETRYPVHWPTHFTAEESSKAKTACDHVRKAITDELAIAKETDAP
jgi:hypothetical protein